MFYDKLGRSAIKSLKSVVLEFYSNEQIMAAKGLLLDTFSTMDISNFPKSIRKRRDSTSNISTEFDDIIAILSFLDEHGHLDGLPLFVADHPDHIPSSKLLEGDLDLLWTKLDRLESYVKQVCEN